MTPHTHALKYIMTTTTTTELTDLIISMGSIREYTDEELQQFKDKYAPDGKCSPELLIFKNLDILANLLKKGILNVQVNIMESRDFETQVLGESKAIALLRSFEWSPSTEARDLFMRVYSCTKQHTDCCLRCYKMALLGIKEYVNEPIYSRHTPLMEAARYCNIYAVTLLVKRYNADIFYRDAEGRTALDHAKEARIFHEKILPEIAEKITSNEEYLKNLTGLQITTMLAKTCSYEEIAAEEVLRLRACQKIIDFLQEEEARQLKQPRQKEITNYY